MSSGLPAIPNAARTIVKELTPAMMRRVETLGMSPRQQDLNWRWSFYTCNEYDARKVDWDGSERVEHIDHEAIATAGVLPGGFYMATADFPLKFRHPLAPRRLGRVIVNRFTGMLFSESQHPTIRCVGDPDTEDYVNALATRARLWAKLIEVRNFGGATGSACAGFKFLNGRPIIEVHDPRWVTPTFKSMTTLELEQLDKRYMYPEFQPGPNDEWKEVWFWYRRIITDKFDVVWQRVPVGDGDEPRWEEIKPTLLDQHDFGFVPARWVQNLPVCDSEDGESDVHGAYDSLQEIDALQSQSLYSTKGSCEPNLAIATDKPLREIKKGVDNAIKVEKGGSVSLIESAGTAAKQAMDSAKELRAQILEMCQCVLDHDADGKDMTATEARQRFASMHAKTDQLREQYGQGLVVPIIEDMLRAVRKLNEAQPGKAPNGGPLKRVVTLPPRELTSEDGTKSYRPRELPADQNGVLDLDWPAYLPPSLEEASSAATAVSTAKNAESIDLETAVHFLAPYLGIKDVAATIAKVKAESQEKQKQAEERAREAFASRGGF